MKAIQYSKFGGPEVLKYVTDAPKPKPAKGEVLVKIAAAALNPIDYKAREGHFPFNYLTKLPKIPGGDLTGVVEEGGTKLKAGDKVFAVIDPLLKNGTLAEYVAVAEFSLVKVPSNITTEEAAGVPLAGATAWQALEAAGVKEGSRVFIPAGAGGVGTLAIQLAKARKAIVATTTSARNVDFVKGLGADEVVDYTKDDFVQVFKDKPFDAVIETLGGQAETDAFKVLKKGGNFQSILTGKTPFYTSAFRVLAGKLGLGPAFGVILLDGKLAGGFLTQIADLIQAGKVKPIVDKVFPLEQAEEAFKYLEKGHARGKVIIKV